MSLVHIGIGSNLGDRRSNCLEAIRRLEENGISVTKRSSLHETEPWGVRDQPKFINMVVEAETALEPEELLAALKRIEQDMGRLPSSRWGPRVMDLDILFYDDLIINDADLKIPHELLHERSFVLGPLSEIAPEKIHPVLRKKIKDLLARHQKPEK